MIESCLHLPTLVDFLQETGTSMIQQVRYRVRTLSAIYSKLNGESDHVVFQGSDVLSAL